MVVDDLDVGGIGARPAKTDAPLVVDADTVLALAIVAKLLQPVARRNPEIIEPPCRVDQSEFPEHHASELGWEASDGLARPEAFRVTIGESPDHPE